MRTRDENFLTMAHAVNAVVQKNQPKWINVERFATCAQELKDLVSLTSDINASADSKITGAAEKKGEVCVAAVEAGVKLAKRTRVYAKDKKNLELYERLNLSTSAILAKHDAEVLATLKDWIVRLTPISAELAPYGILPADIYHFKDLVDELDTILTRPRELIVARKTMNQSQLPQLLANIRDVLENMDNLINLFEATPFEVEYFNSRIVIDLGSRNGKSGEEKPEPPVV